MATFQKLTRVRFLESSLKLDVQRHQRQRHYDHMTKACGKNVIEKLNFIKKHKKTLLIKT